jgi:hypothetical protein
MLRQLAKSNSQGLRFLSKTIPCAQAPHVKIVYTPEYYASLKKSETKKDDLNELINKWDEQFRGVETNERIDNSRNGEKR